MQHYEDKGLIPLEDEIPLYIDHRVYLGEERYAEGYKLIHYYMSPLIDKHDRKLATSLMDTSHFITKKPEEKRDYYKKIIKETELCQEIIISLGESMKEQLLKGEVNDFEIGYVVSLTDEYKDDKGAKWVDIYIDLNCYYERNDVIDLAGEHYRMSVKQYNSGWKIARISES